MIVCKNFAKKVDTIRDRIGNELNMEEDKVASDTIVIKGHLESEFKFVCTQKFTKRPIDPITDIAMSNYYPRVLITTSCIRVGLDCNDVH